MYNTRNQYLVPQKNLKPSLLSKGDDEENDDGFEYIKNGYGGSITTKDPSQSDDDSSDE